MPTIDTDDYLSPEEAAAEIGVTADTVRKYCNIGKLTALKDFGYALRIHKDEVARFAREKRTRPGRPRKETT